MRDINKIIIRGTVTDDPKQHTFTTQQGDEITNTTLSVLTELPPIEGSQYPRRFWHRVRAVNKLGDVLSEFREGDRIYSEGVLRIYKYKDKTTGIDRQGHELKPNFLRKVTDPVDIHTAILCGVCGGGRVFTKLTSFSVGTQAAWSPKNREPDMTWHDVTLFEPMTYPPEKGDRLLVQGTLRSRKYEDQNGIEQRRVSCVADGMMLNFQKNYVPSQEDDSGVDHGGYSDEPPPF